MAGVSGVNGIDEETLYYQYLINHNSASTMLNALSGDSSDDDSISSGISSLCCLSGLSGTSGLSGLSGVSQDSSFATILQSYLTKAIHSQNDSAQDAQMAEKLSDVLQEAAKTEDTSNTTYKTVQELDEYFTEKMSGTAASLINGSAAAQSTNSTNNTNSTQNSTSAQSTAEQMNQAALVGQEFDFSTIDSIVEQMFSESTPLS